MGIVCRKKEEGGTVGMDESTGLLGLKPWNQKLVTFWHCFFTRVQLLDLAFPFGNGRMTPANGPCEKGPES